MKKNNVLMLVRNNISRDARVLKTANSLQKKGYQVDLFGVIEKNSDLHDELLPNGVNIKRVPFRYYTYLYLSIFYAFALFTSIIFILRYFLIIPDTSTILANLLTLNYSYLFDVGKNLIPSSLEFFKLHIIEILLSFSIIYVLFNGLRRNLKFLSNYKALEGVSGSQGALKKSIYNIYNIYNINNLLESKRIFKVLMASFSYKSSLLKNFKKNGFKYAYIHCHDISTLPVGLQLKENFKDTRLIYDAHELYEEAVGVEGPLKYIYKKIHRDAQSFIDGFITISDDFSRIYKERYPKLPEPTVVMNATKFKTLKKYDGRLHLACGIDKNKKIILFQGGFTLHRGIERMLQVVEYLSDDYCFVFMGWGNREKLIKRVSKKNKGKVFILPPAPQDELINWTSGGFIGVIPYEQHGMNHTYCTPNKLWEFPAAHVPIFAAPRVQLKKIVESNNIGWIYEERHGPYTLANEIMSFSRKRKSKVDSCKKFTKVDSWEKYEKDLYKLYQSLA